MRLKFINQTCFNKSTINQFRAKIEIKTEKKKKILGRIVKLIIRKLNY